MNAPPIEYTLLELLKRAGARLVSNRRADCPRCSGRRTIAFTQESFFCHHEGCSWKGNVVTLARELGLMRRLTSDELRAHHWLRQKAHEKAEELYQRTRDRRLKLYHHYRSLLSIADRVHRARNPQDECAWSRLARVYRILPCVTAELAILEDGPLPALLSFINAGRPDRKEQLSRITDRGGLYDREGRFIEIETRLPGVSAK